MMSGKIVIRETVPADLAAIVEVPEKGFGYDREAGLTAEGLRLLRERGAKLGLRTRTQGVLPAPRIHPRRGKTGVPGPLSDRGKTCGLLDGAGIGGRRIFGSPRPGRMRRRPEPPRTLAGIKPHLR